MPSIDADSKKNRCFIFVDLFAEIGGVRLGSEEQGGHCVFTSEWNTLSQKTYFANFLQDNQHIFVGDISQVDENDVSDHDVLLVGFLCQPFS